MAKPKIITRETKTYAKGMTDEQFKETNERAALSKKLNDYETGYQAFKKSEIERMQFEARQDAIAGGKASGKPDFRSAQGIAKSPGQGVAYDDKVKREEYKGIYNYEEQRKQGLADADAIRMKDEEGKLAAQLAADEITSKKNEIKGARARQRMQAMGASGRRDTILTGPLGLSMFDDPIAPRNARKTLLGA